MGLCLIAGILVDLKDQDEEGADHYRAQFNAVNQALKAAGLPPHQEPETLEISYSGDMFGYSTIHHLRRIAAHSWAGTGLPGPADDNTSDDPLVEKYAKTLGARQPSLLSRLFGKSRPASPPYDHLMFHSDAEGYYLPQDFHEVLFPASNLKIAGEMIGSSVRLKAECEALARLLGIPPGLDPGSDEVHEVMEDPKRADAPWKIHATASFACLRLREACEFSLKHKTAIVFS